ncbi:MAG: ArnT family glycosyltransferase [Chthoniobacterales bacterium]
MTTNNEPRITSRNYFNGYIILPLLAIFYYGYYYRCGLYPSGEGGVEGVTALRLISGKLPIVEVALNYNLLWFYPIVWLFKIGDPSYTAIRVFFFTLSTLTCLLAYGIVWKTTCRATLAFLAGMIVLLLPGQLFRNYMAFIVMLNMAVFLKAYILPCKNNFTRFVWLIVSGLTLGLAFLIRLDIGFFLSIISLGLILVFPLVHGFKDKRNWVTTCAALFLVALGVVTIHFPVLHDAKKRGFEDAFFKQYEVWPQMIITQGSRLLHQTLESFSQKKPPLLTPTGSIAGSSKPSTTTVVSSKNLHSNIKSTLTRRSLQSADIREQLMALNLYLPIACSLLLILIATVFLFFGVNNRLLSKLASADEAQEAHGAEKSEHIGICDASSTGATQQFAAEVEFGKKSNKADLHIQRSLAIFTSLGCSLTLFPQYFFWRPDMVHLSEFMVPMSVTILISIAFAYREWQPARSFFKILLSLFLLIASSTILLYFITGIQSQSTGGIAISQHRTIEFHGKNGVTVKLTPNEFEETSAIYQSIINHSAPKDYVICFPYNPEINFMTDRPSYRRDLYIDDLTAPKTFDCDTISEIEKQQPAAIVINNWPINGTEHSRFKNWAAKTYNYIQAHYVLDYEKGILQVFVKPSI